MDTGLTPTKKLFATNTWWQRENQFSPSGESVVCQPHSRWVSCPGEAWQHRSSLFYECALYFVAAFLSYCLVSLFGFLLCVCFLKREGEHEVACTDREVRESWKSCGWRGHIIKIY